MSKAKLVPLAALVLVTAALFITTFMLRAQEGDPPRGACPHEADAYLAYCAERP